MLSGDAERKAIEPTDSASKLKSRDTVNVVELIVTLAAIVSSFPAPPAQLTSLYVAFAVPLIVLTVPSRLALSA